MNIMKKDSVLNEEDPTLWWLVEKYVTISNPLPDVINFYPVIDENTVHISPIQNAINIVSERLEKLKESYNKIQVENEVSESDKLLIQGTIDPGVLGGLPKYKKFFLLTEPSENLKKSEFLKQLIVDTINWGEALLESAINHLPTDHLLNIIKNEQLPKLKRLFDLPTLNEYKKNGELHCIANFESTPKILSKTPSSSDQNSLNKSFLNKVQENYTGRTILSYFGVCDKPNTSSFGLIPNSSQRDSISSIKSVNSDEDFSNRKIILDEAISSKRPLRRFKNLNNSSTSNSNQSSRPISNLSGEDQNFGQFINNFDQNEIGKLHEDNFSDKAPPKPPKMKNIQIMSRDCLNHNSFIETFSNDQSKSSTSLNSVPFRCLSTKTISDSVLNKIL
ncbi:dedicator of cytokinesis 1 isoform X1 [Brachionus plicatilis]|uniref:Dedicator of cytokinesis 1 isoform X1 n=1 Tax=Brachionus plicatilis TaxID=10195 RepID=A0A3M7T0Y3_BRAPC|nr:dedicator of cytokinesis 1 isoform X1 [Brachionus plicatilis]